MFFYTVQLLYTVKDKDPYPLTYGLRDLYRNLKYENFQDNAQKPHRNWTFMNVDFWIQFQHLQHCAIGDAADEAVLNNLTEKYAYFGRERHAVGIISTSAEMKKELTVRGARKKVLFLL